MPRSFSWNAWESDVASPITDVGTSLTLESEVGLRAPGYLVIEPESPTKREYIYFASLNGATLEGLSRGLGGSIDGGVAHDPGVKVRAVAMHQMFDDLWDSVGSGSSDLTNHINNPNDPHALAGYFTQAQGDERYVNVASDTMEGPLDMGGFPLSGLTVPVADQDAATKSYVDVHVVDFDQHIVDFDQHIVDFDQHVADAGDTYIPLAGGKVASTLEVSGDVNLSTIRARVNDIHFEDLGGADLFRWDDSIDQWEFKKNVTLEGNLLISPGNPTTASHVGDRGYNDARYLSINDGYSDADARAAVDNNTYLKLSGGVLFGDLTLPAGTSTNTVLKFGPMAANDGMYGDTNELSVSFDGQRKFSVFSTASGESANVVVRASTLVPFKIERQVTGGDAAFMMRFTQTGVGEVLLNMGALRWLADNHNTL